jgi:predicted nucleic acid-binding protein
METVYIETSIASFYHETRRNAESLARKHWTRHWWSVRRQHFVCHTSIATIDELERGNHPMKADKLSVVAELNLLEINHDIREIAKVYISNYLMPAEIIGDALHVAIASYHKMDYLLTWNCNHLANANKKKHLRRINERLHLNTPEIITPLELMGE